jgi:frataxin-like iron-binding protein CyaY
VNENQPWKNHATNQTKYASYKGQHDQTPIRDSKDSKYFVNKNHPQHNTWVQQQKHGKGNNKK